MKKLKRKTFILGAGFSNNAGIPLQEDFLRELITMTPVANNYHNKLANILAEGIRGYIKRFFGNNPDLEDVFTCLDMSANTGHCLSRDFPPSRLRAIRRVFIARIIQLLNSLYRKRPILNKFFKIIDLENSNFVCLNWDTVVEREIERLYGSPVAFDYGNGAVKAGNGLNQKAVYDKIKIAKVHGSSNWLYCDNCRRIYYLNPKYEIQVPYQIIKRSDLRSLANANLVDKKRVDGLEFKPEYSKFKCQICSMTLGTRMATFSYRKVLDAPMLLKSWFWTEQLLSEADEWIFIGYSLPSADYEFKYLLKRIEKASNSGKNISITTLKKFDSYEKFFDPRTIKARYTGGLFGYLGKMKT